jgi:hypothetical protein
MFNNEMLQKLQQMKSHADESKTRLGSLKITEESGGGLVRITMDGNRNLESVEINANINTLEKEDLEDLLVVAFKRTLDKVNEINEKEVMSSAQNLFPGM